MPFKSEFRSKKLIELIKTVFERNLNICIRLCVGQTDNTYVVDLIKALTCACFWGHISMVPQLAKLNSLYCKTWSYVRGFHCAPLPPPFDRFKIKFIIIIMICKARWNNFDRIWYMNSMEWALLALLNKLRIEISLPCNSYTTQPYSINFTSLTS